MSVKLGYGPVHGGTRDTWSLSMGMAHGGTRETASLKHVHGTRVPLLQLTPGGCLFSWVGTKWKRGTKWSHSRGGGVPLAGYQVVKGYQVVTP